MTGAAMFGKPPEKAAVVTLTPSLPQTTLAIPSNTYPNNSRFHDNNSGFHDNNSGFHNHNSRFHDPDRLSPTCGAGDSTHDHPPKRNALSHEHRRPRRSQRPCQNDGPGHPPHGGAGGEGGVGAGVRDCLHPVGAGGDGLQREPQQRSTGVRQAQEPATGAVEMTLAEKPGLQIGRGKQLDANVL